MKNKILFVVILFNMLNDDVFAQAPGGVSAGLAHWHKADDYGGALVEGASVISWNDASGFQNGTQGVASYRGVFKANFQNFNPSITFDGIDDRYNLPNNVLGTGNTDFTILTIATKNTAASNKAIVAYGNNGTNGGIIHEYDQPSFEYSFLGAGAFGGSLTINDRANSLFAQDYSNSSNNKTLYQLERNVANANVGALNLGSDFNRVGSRAAGAVDGFFFSGDINEIITYNRTLSHAERQRVSSYLAIKYGLTLSNNNNGNGNNFESPNAFGVHEGDYVHSSSLVVWDASANNTYHNDIAGIGRDDFSELNQKQSKSVETDALVTMGLTSIETTNTLNTANFSANLNFMLWGNNNSSIASWTAAESFGVFNRIAREWLVQETGTVGSLLVRIPNNNSTETTKLPATSGTVMLLVDGDGNFSSGATAIPMTLNGTYWEVSYDFSNGQYFTFAEMNCNANSGNILAPTECFFFGENDVLLNTDGSHESGNIQSYALTDITGIILDISSSPNFSGLPEGDYRAYAVNYAIGGVDNLNIGTDIDLLTGFCFSTSPFVDVQVCVRESNIRINFHKR